MKKMTIYTDRPAKVIIDKDTIKSLNNETQILVTRQRGPVNFTVFNDTVRKNITIDSHTSCLFWSNLAFAYGVGILVDLTNPKRFTYPSTVYLSMKDNTSFYKTMDNRFLKNKYIVKFSPLKAMDISNPGIEFTVEHQTSDNFSTQVMASWLFTRNMWNFHNSFYQNIQGSRFAIEEKYYFKHSAPMGPYLSAEANYLNKMDLSYNHHEYNDSNPNASSYIDTIAMHKQTLSLNLKIGYQYYFMKRLAVDFYIGLGVRYKDVNYYAGSNPNKWAFLFDWNDPAGKFWLVNMPMGFRIGWAF